MIMTGLTGERILQAKYGTVKRADAFYTNQMLHELNEQMMEFIRKQELVFVSTADEKGNCDASIRVGPPGFVRVIDSETLVYPEFRGNGVMASLGNILENPHIGLLFIDFFQTCIGLHVNGRAEIIENDQVREKLSLPDDILRSFDGEDAGLAERWVCIKVDEAYIHCSKHIPLLKKLDKEIHWGTDDEKMKGGDFFRIKA
jgi:predicted pyridoxine 5'-phosphate oxidase superfamily flavin-nucleotide-binding protein